MCRHYLLLVASQELTPALWAKVAPSDIVQDTLMAAGHDFPRFLGENEEELLAWIRRILRNNVTEVHRQFQTEKRQASREVPLSEVPRAEMPVDTADSSSREFQAREEDEKVKKSPATAARTLSSSVADAHDRRIIVRADCGDDGQHRRCCLQSVGTLRRRVHETYEAAR